MRQEEFEKILKEIAPKLENLGRVTYVDMDESDSETKSRYYAILGMTDLLSKIGSLCRDMYNSQVAAVGRLVKKENGRYVIEGTNQEFTTGDSIHVWMEEEGYWEYSRVEHHNDYFIVALGKIETIEGKLVRRPVYNTVSV